MKLSEFVKKLEDLNYQHFHSHRVDGSVPDEPLIFISTSDNILGSPRLFLDPEYGVIISHE